jgi:methionine aminopeptidase
MSMLFTINKRQAALSSRRRFFVIIMVLTSIALLMGRQRPLKRQRFLAVSAWVHSNHREGSAAAARPRLIHSTPSTRSASSLVVPSPSSIQRWMSSSSEKDTPTTVSSSAAAAQAVTEEKTPEEMERIKAEREARKYVTTSHHLFRFSRYIRLHTSFLTTK